MRKRSQEERIFFPWERRGGLIRRFGLGRARPFMWATLVACVLVAIAYRERRAAGIRRTRAVIEEVSSAVDRYRADHDGQCPRKFAQLEPYRKEQGSPRDAWGNVLRLTCPSPRGDLPYRISSDGPDSKPGGLDRVE
jgi:Type II secretion system (T2SS), protein G